MILVLPSVSYNLTHVWVTLISYAIITNDQQLVDSNLKP
jgi:hypothetical protein